MGGSDERGEERAQLAFNPGAKSGFRKEELNHSELVFVAQVVVTEDVQEQLAIERVEGFLKVQLEDVGSFAKALGDRSEILERPEELTGAPTRKVGVLVKRKEGANFAADALINYEGKDFTEGSKEDDGASVFDNGFLGGGLVQGNQEAGLEIRDGLVTNEDSVEELSDSLVELRPSILEEFGRHAVDTFRAIVTETSGGCRYFRASDGVVEGSSFALPLRERDGIGALEEVGIVFSDRRELPFRAPKLVTLLVVENQTMGCVLAEDSSKFEGGSGILAGLKLRSNSIDVSAFKFEATGSDLVKQWAAAST